MFQKFSETLYGIQGMAMRVLQLYISDDTIIQISELSGPIRPEFIPKLKYLQGQKYIDISASYNLLIAYGTPISF